MIAAEQISDHYFALNLAGVPEQRFTTLAAALTAVLKIQGAHGTVTYHRDMTTAGQTAMEIYADGTWIPKVLPSAATGTDAGGL